MNQNNQTIQQNQLSRDSEEDRKTFTTILTFVYPPLALLLISAAFLVQTKW